MELLPIIYNSLIIAAGLFVITLAISYVSYKFRQKNGDDVKATASATQDKHLKNEDDAELKPKYKSPPPRKSDRTKIEEKKKRVEKSKPPQKEVRQIKKQKPKKEDNTRIEVVKDLSKAGTKEYEPPKTKHAEKPRSADKKKKNLKSIDEDPIKKYTDSSDDDLHHLKTDE